MSKKYLIIIIFCLSISQSYASIDSLLPLNSFSFNIAYQHYFHKGNFIPKDLIDIYGNPINTINFAPSVAQNKPGFSFGISYEHRFFKKRHFFTKMSLGYGKINYGIGFRYNLSDFWDVPALKNLVIDTVYQLKYPLLYADLKLGYKIPIHKKTELGFLVGLRYNQLIARYNIQNVFTLFVPHNGNFYIFDKIATTNILQVSFVRLHTFQAGINISHIFFNKKLHLELSYQNSIWYDKKVGIASFVYHRVKNYDENTGNIETEISGSSLFLNRLRNLELSLSYDF